MFVFGINLPVAEILVVLMLLFIVAVVFIIVQLVKMGKQIRVLDETTLEIRRYESEEEITLKPLLANPAALSATEKRDFLRRFIPATNGLSRAAAVQLAAGKSPAGVKNALMDRGIAEPTATRAVNNAVVALNRYASLSTADAKREARRFVAAARAK
jgi:type IV pilus biogenesis protein CpaD/CtpE